MVLYFYFVILKIGVPLFFLFEMVEILCVNFAFHIWNVRGLLVSNVNPVNPVEKRVHFDFMNAQIAYSILRIAY
jgi:hypothetical protein